MDGKSSPYGGWFFFKIFFEMIVKINLDIKPGPIVI